MKKLKNINIPVLVMHGEADQIVPFWMGKKIFNLASEPKYSYFTKYDDCLLYTSPSPRDIRRSRMPSSA